MKRAHKDNIALSDVNHLRSFDIHCFLLTAASPSRFDSHATFKWSIAQSLSIMRCFTRAAAVLRSALHLFILDSRRDNVKRDEIQQIRRECEWISLLYQIFDCLQSKSNINSKNHVKCNNDLHLFQFHKSYKNLFLMKQIF